MENYGRAVAEIESSAHDPSRSRSPRTESASAPILRNVTKEEYCAMVEKTKEYIVDGDIFVRLSPGASRARSPEPAGSLPRPRTTNPSPYMVFMRIDDMELMSTSPETLVRLQNGGLHLPRAPRRAAEPRRRT